MITKYYYNSKSIDFNNFKWGPLKDDLRATFYKEYKEGNPYERIYKVKKNDIVLDIGASNGIYTSSILHRKPKHVFCIEPTKTLFPYLVKNTLGHPVTHINKALSMGDGTVSHGGGSYSPPDTYETIMFTSFIRNYGVDYIDYIKTDCEGGEYHLFNPESIDFLLNNVGCIVGEFHLGNKVLKENFTVFRDKYLTRFKNYAIYDVGGKDVTNLVFDRTFISYYNELILHISNK